MLDRVPKLLRPGWVLLHLLVVLACVAMVLAGRWQWGRGVELGALRNYSYGIEWYAFALLVLIGWVKFCHDETVPDPDAGVLHGAVEAAVDTTAVARADQWNDDPEVAAWNARFAELHRNHALREAGLAPDDVRQLADPDRKLLS